MLPSAGITRSTVLSPFPFPPATGLPRLPVSPSLRAVPTTPTDRNGCIRRLLPRSTWPSPNLRRVGVHIFTFEACSGFTRVRPARSLNRPGRPLSQGFGPAGYPTRPPVSYQIKPTTVWVDPSSTGVTRRRGTLKFSGNTDVSVTNCVIALNSSDSSAASVSGSAAVETDCVAVVGEVSATDGLVLTQCEVPVTGSAPISDPYSDLVVPTYPYYCDQNNFKIAGNPNQQTIVYPGRYCGGMTLQAGEIIMQSSVYIIDDGDFEIRAQAEVQGSGVTIVLLDSSGNSDPTVTINGGADIDLSAPTSGECSGILFFQDRTSSGGPNTFNGNSSRPLPVPSIFQTKQSDFWGTTKR